MTHSKTIFTAAALFAAAVTFAGLAAPFNASARAAASQTAPDVVAERIGGAFATIDFDAVSPARQATAVRGTKGDLFAAADCASQTWPNIAARCLVTDDGSPAQEARFVTVGYQTGDAQTVLVRVPSSEVSVR
jgi:hypothetical protein